MKKVALFLTGIIYSASVYAVSADDQNILDQLKVLNGRLKTSSVMETCKTPDVPACSFQSMCNQFGGKGRDIYLYQNAEGRQIPNFPMTTYLSLAERCFEADAEDQRVKDPFIYNDTLFDPDIAGSPDQLNKNFLRYEKEGQRAEKLFNETKEQVLSVLKNRRTSQNAKEIDNMIERVRTVQFNFPKQNEKLKELAKHGCDIPNAFYSPSDHKVTVCPQILNLPDAALVSTFAHELGHSIDPCVSQKSFSRENGDNGATITANDITDDSNTGKNVFEKISAARNPFGDVIQCLQKTKSLNIRVPSKKEVLAGATAANKKNLSTYYNQISVCAEYSGSGHMQEGFSDWISSQVLKNNVTKIQDVEAAKRYAFESQAVFLGTSCKNVQQTAVAYVRPVIQRQCENLTRLMDTADESDDVTRSHPSTAGRVNRILYAPPEMQKALGCKSTDPVLTECK